MPEDKGKTVDNLATRHQLPNFLKWTRMMSCASKKGFILGCKDNESEETIHNT